MKQLGDEKPQEGWSLEEWNHFKNHMEFLLFVWCMYNKEKRPPEDLTLTNFNLSRYLKCTW